MVRTERNEEMTTAIEVVGSNPVTCDDHLLPRTLELREEVDSIIEQGMTDLWLLLAGEGLGARPWRMNHDGQAFAMVFDGQMHLLGAKPLAMDVLRSVGLDLSGFDPGCEG